MDSVPSLFISIKSTSKPELTRFFAVSNTEGCSPFDMRIFLFFLLDPINARLLASVALPVKIILSFWLPCKSLIIRCLPSNISFFTFTA